MVAGAVVNGELEKILQKEEVIRQEDNIVSLADGGNILRIKIYSKLRVLGNGELVSIVDGVQVSRGDASLLKSKLVVNWTKDLPVPFKEGSSVL